MTREISLTETLAIMAIMIIVLVGFMFYEKGVFTNCRVSEETNLEKSINEMNSEANELLGEVLEARLADKLQSGEITEEMIEEMTSLELFYAIMAD